MIKEIIEIVKSLEDSGLLLKGVSETIQDKASKQKGGFFNMLIGTLDAKKQEMQTVFTKINLTKLVFKMMWNIEILKTEQEEQLLIKFEEIKHLILKEILNMMDIKEG